MATLQSSSAASSSGVLRGEPGAGEGSSTSEPLWAAIDDVAVSFEQLYRAGDAFLGHHAEARPRLVVGAAAGLGFALGGGLVLRMARLLVNVAARVAASRAMDGFIATLGPRRSLQGAASAATNDSNNQSERRESRE